MSKRATIRELRPDEEIDPKRDCYTEEEVAKKLGIGVPSLRNRIAAKEPHPPFLQPWPRGPKYFLKSDFNRWFRSFIHRVDR